MNSAAPEQQQSNIIMQRFLVVWLPILIVAALVLWLSGGIPPTVLRLLLQMLGRWHSLQAALGNAVFLPFVIVLIQCLLLLAAWVILALIIWREIAFLSNLRMQQRHARILASLSSPSTTQTPANPVPASQGVQMTVADLDTMFDENDETVQAKNTGIRLVSNESENDDSFDPSMAVFELRADPEESETDLAQSPSQREPAEEMVFVYGDPFDGELPEVFHYDMDLKREIEDMQNVKQSQTDEDQPQERTKQHVGRTTDND
jgi:hypothetical protein